MTVNFARLACVLMLLGAETGALRAQMAVPPPSLAAQQNTIEFQKRIAAVAAELENDPKLKKFSAAQRQRMVEFVTGNMLFVATHELGHAVVSELDLPVLGREEDAADDFATLTGLVVVANDFSQRVLTESARGWFLSAQRDTKAGDTPTYYDRHGLSEQRAYQIVCLMVGSDPVKYKPLADKVGLPEERFTSCGWDYDTALRSWGKVLAPHRRAPERPEAKFEIIYGDATGPLAVFARNFREIRFLETIAGLAQERFVWPKPITFEMRSCGEPNARWTIETRRLHICYELALEFVELYKDFGEEAIALRAKAKTVRVVSRGGGAKVRSAKARGAKTRTVAAKAGSGKVRSFKPAGRTSGTERRR